jgi:Zn-dependent peptidase ImmA (M78 family)
MARIDVSPEILQWAADRSGKSKVIQENFPNWIKWINNESQPTFKQVEKLAKATSTPLGYFFLSEPPVERLPIPHYRTTDDSQNNNPSADLLETVQTMERRQDWMREYLIDQKYEPIHFVETRNLTHSPYQIAKEIRSELGLKNGWAANCSTWQDALRMLLNKIEDIRILVVVNGIVGNNTRRKLDVNEFRGFVLVDEYAPLIFVNGADGKAAQMFTLIHELAHIWYGASAAFDLQKLQPSDNEIERACNIVAAEFLVPEIELRELWPNVQNGEERFQIIARRFKVSEIVVARRALDLQLIAKNEFFDFYENRYVRDFEEAQARDTSGGNFYATQSFRISNRFADTVIRATMGGQLQHHEAYRLTGLRGKTFSEFAVRLGFGGDI